MALRLASQQQKCFYQVRHLQRRALNFEDGLANSVVKLWLFKHKITSHAHYRKRASQLVTGISGEFPLTRNKVVYTLNKMAQGIA